MSNDRDCQCDEAHAARKVEFQYAVKLVCGTVDCSEGDGGGTHGSAPMAPGRYWTAINIHNPGKCGAARFRWKVAVAEPVDSERSGLITPFRSQVLGPDAALEIDCDHIVRTLPVGMGGFVKGYVVIESDVELDVVAVYSGTTGSNAGVSGFHTERVPPRCVPVCEDLSLPLHTGVANWQTVAPTPGVHGPVEPVNGPTPPWIVPPSGARWVSQTASDGGGADFGVRYYELCFSLCSGFIRPERFVIEMAVDDEATVYLNDAPVATIPGPGFTALHAFAVDPAYLHVGRNCLRVEVNNSGGGPTGFVLAGTLRVGLGQCP